jgi:heme exporter protein D
VRPIRPDDGIEHRDFSWPSVAVAVLALFLVVAWFVVKREHAYRDYLRRRRSP